MKLEEIATITGAPLSTIKSRVQRGLETLRRKL
jgi:DNA-directed RNA polymerase specialized sigma24 family protein